MKTKRNQPCQKCSEKGFGMLECQCKPQHAPTPWRVSHYTGGILEGVNVIRSDNDEIDICSMVDHPKVGKANAAFIVRAVNCHEELVGMLKVYRNELMERANKGDKAVLHGCQLVDRAIAKAEGL